MPAVRSVKLDATEEVVMKICSRHAKKRQLTYLMPGDNEGEWVCKESDQCKLSGPKNAAKIAAEEQIVGNTSTPAVHSADSFPSTCIPARRITSEANGADQLDRSVGDVATPLSGPSVISWADEVDQEFPEGYVPADEYRSDFMEHTPYHNEHPFTAHHSFPTTPRQNSGQKFNRFKGRPSGPPDVLSRVEQLEEELGQTKRELRKAKEDLKTVMKSEKRLELTVRELMSEVLHIRRKQLQLDLSGHDDRLRKQVADNSQKLKLNPDATPFVPVSVTHWVVADEAKNSGDGCRNADSARTDSARNGDSARSTNLSVLEVASFDSENFGRDDIRADSPLQSPRASENNGSSTPSDLAPHSPKDSGEDAMCFSVEA